jgi:hypothetical protein
VITQAVRRLPTHKRIVFLADRGFIHSKLMEMLTTQLDWHYQIWLKSNSWIYRVGKGWTQLRNFHFNRGQALCLHSVLLHKGDRQCELTTLKTFQEYGLRFDIEENFLDDQSNGCNIQRSEIRLQSILTDTFSANEFLSPVSNKKKILF